MDLFDLGDKVKKQPVLGATCPSQWKIEKYVSGMTHTIKERISESSMSMTFSLYVIASRNCYK